MIRPKPRIATCGWLMIAALPSTPNAAVVVERERAADELVLRGPPFARGRGRPCGSRRRARAVVIGAASEHRRHEQAAIGLHGDARG